MLEGVEFPWDLKSIIRWHPEKLDGTGYPDRLRGEEISAQLKWVRLFGGHNPESHLCYGLAGAYMRRWAKDVPSRGMALGTQIAGGLLLAPLLAIAPPTSMPTPFVAACVLAMGLLCGAVAYLLYFRLVADIGAAGALTVTYLIPIFGVAWGALFLGETVSLVMLAGAGLVLLGTFFVLRK